MASRRFRFVLDEKVDADLIEAIEQMANGGAASKAIVKILHEWQTFQTLKDKMPGVTEEAAGVTTGVTGDFGPDQALIRPCLGPNQAIDGELIEEFNGIFEQM